MNNLFKDQEYCFIWSCCMKGEPRFQRNMMISFYPSLVLS